MARAFISYSHADERLKDQFLAHLAALRHEGLIDIWHDRHLRIGEHLSPEIQRELAGSDLVILLVSSDFIASNYCYEEEMKRAFERQGRDGTLVASVIIRPCQWHKVPVGNGRALGDFLAAPKDGRAVTEWPNVDTAFADVVGKIGELLRQRPGPSASDAAPTESPQTEPTEPAGPQNKRPMLGHRTSTAFFAERFAQAFPGVREIEWFREEIDIRRRLERLLAEPLVFGDGIPIWWWRFGNLQIEQFRHLHGRSYLMPPYELNIKKIAAIHGSDYYRHAVYVEVNPEKPIGLYEHSAEKIKDAEASNKIVYEEYGLFNGDTPISRSMFDDGAAIIDGEIVETAGRSELRVRYLTPYNFLIAPHGSPVNNSDFDERLETLMDAVISDERNISPLQREMEALPRRREHGPT